MTLQEFLAVHPLFKDSRDGWIGKWEPAQGRDEVCLDGCFTGQQLIAIGQFMVENQPK